MAKRGPKTEPNLDELKRTNLCLDDMTRRRLRVLGDGNESRGVREAARVAFEVYQGGRPTRDSWIELPGGPT